MTAPDQVDTSTAEQLRDEHDAQVAALEEQAAAQAAAPYAVALAAALVAATGLWAAMFGDIGSGPDDDEQAAGYRRRLLGLLDELPDGDQVDLAGWIRRAALLGGWQAAREAGQGEVGLRAARRARPVRRTLDELVALPARIGRAYAEARTLAAAGLVEYGDVVRVLAAARQAQTTVERTARWTVNRAVADGATQLADDLGLGRVWVNERDACLHCLAYAGRVAAPGEAFPAGLTFADRPLHTGPVPNPPLHPNCRCRVSPWAGTGPGTGPVDFPAGLAREAQRSVLRGWSGSDSNAARLRAVDRLLAAGTGLPRSVQQRARRSVAARRFPRRGAPFDR